MKRTLLYLAILFGGVIFTDWLADSIFSLPPDATIILTKISLQVALAVALLAKLFASRWITLKTTAVTTGVLCLGILGFVIWMIATTPHR